jgi:hypothetical protein
MATTTILDSLLSGLVTSAGVAIASGKVRFYQPGTLTPETVYSDGAGASPISQPVVLSAGGTATVFTLNPVRMQVKDSLDVTLLLDIDQANAASGSNISITSATFNNGVSFTAKAAFDAWSASFGGTVGMWKYKVGTTERNAKDAISQNGLSVKDYGALGDNATDDTTAIQNAINAAIAASVPVLFPAGTYRISAALTVTGALSMIGAGDSASGGTVIKQTSATANGITASAGSLSIQGIVLVCLTASSGIGLSMAVFSVNATRLTIDNTFTTAISTPGGTFVACTFNGPGTFSSAGGQLRFAACIVAGGTFALGSAAGYALLSSCVLSGTFTLTTGAFAFSACNNGAAITIAATVVDSVTFAGTRVFSMTDNRTGAPVLYSVGTGAVSPLIASTDYLRILGTGAGGTVTLNIPSASYNGDTLTIVCSNTSGGAVTWIFTGGVNGYVTSAAVAPATGNRVSLVFKYNKVEGFWYEVSRANTVN